MIKLFKSTLIISALLLLGSCVRENLGIPEGATPLQLFSEGVNEPVTTKAGIDVQTTQIVENAKVGVFAYQTINDAVTPLTNAVNNEHNTEYQEEGASAKLVPVSDRIAWPNDDAENNVSIRAYAPYKAFGEGESMTSFNFPIQSDQRSDENYIASDLLYSAADNQTAEDGGVRLKFDHALSKVTLFVYANSSIDLRGATVKIKNVPTSVTFNAQTGVATPSEQKADLTVATFADDAKKFECSFILAPHQWARGTFITVSTKAGKDYTVTLGDKTFKAGEYYEYGVNIKTAAEIIEANIGTWENGHSLLNIGDGEIQSLTFMSEFQDGTAAAYYELLDGENGKVKTPKDEIEFNYMVRPVSAAKIFDGYMDAEKFKMVGYYAFTRANFDPIDFTVRSVSAEKDGEGNYTGVVTVVTDNPLSADFYNKSTGALVALSVTDEETNTDFASKFVTLLPRDVCRDVYVTGLSLSTTSATVETNKTLQIVATVAPGDATNKGVTWEVTSGEDVISVDQNGNITAGNMEGTANILVTTKGTDENGNHLSATIYVKVVKEELRLYITGPTSVETDGGVNNQTIELELLYRPVDFIINNVQWEVVNGSGAAASIVADQTDPTTALLTGLAYKNIAEEDKQPIYEEVTVRVTAEGKSAEAKVRVTPWMPKSVAFEDGSEAEMTMIVGESYTFSAHIEPDYSILKDLNWYSTASATPTMAVATNTGSYTFYATAEMIEKSPVTITARSSDSYYTYIQGTRKINVIPRYVESIAFDSATHTMDQGQTWTPSMTFTPANATFQSYTLTSSNPDLLTISGNTITANPDYEMNSASETVTLTATSVGSKEDGTYATATCQVTVNRVIDITGWYYYTDGTCTENYNSGKTVAGIVFSTNDITGEDGTISSAYSGGLVVGLNDYGTAKWATSDDVSPTNYLTSNNTNIANGYSNTQKLLSSGASTHPIVSYIGSLPTVQNASSWFIPSYREFTMLVANKDVVNTAIATAGGTRVADAQNRQYWLSTMGDYQKAYYYYHSSYWRFGTQWLTSSYYVRHIFAIKPVNP